MWAHYYDEHKGFCIGFIESQLTINNEAMLSINVKYQADLPDSSLVKGLSLNEKNELIGTVVSQVVREIIVYPLEI